MKRVVPILICLVLAACVIAAGCVSEDTKSTTGPKWLHAGIVGVVTPETNVSVVDDFYTAMRREKMRTFFS